jgi:hypothetical protein
MVWSETAVRAITAVVIPDVSYLRSPEHAAAKGYFRQLVLLGSKVDTPRPELTEAANYIKG